MTVNVDHKRDEPVTIVCSRRRIQLKKEKNATSQDRLLHNQTHMYSREVHNREEIWCPYVRESITKIQDDVTKDS